MSERDVLMSVRNLKVHFEIKQHTGGLFTQTETLKAVDDVSFDLYDGETLGIVGESGCGKSTLARALFRMIPSLGGEVFWKGEDIMHFSAARMLELRREIQMVFQDPLASLNPRMNCGAIVAEPLKTHFKHMSRSERRDKVVEVLEKVGMGAEHYNRYPHEFSGGQCQRIGIARALVTGPKMLICDEPVSALDVSVQAQVVNLLMDLQKELGLSMLFIAHDLSVVKHISDRIMVLKFGNIAELGESHQVINNPQHPYTKKLIEAVPIPDPAVEKARRAAHRAKRAAENA